MGLSKEVLERLENANPDDLQPLLLKDEFLIELGAFLARFARLESSVVFYASYLVSIIGITHGAIAGATKGRNASELISTILPNSPVRNGVTLKDELENYRLLASRRSHIGHGHLIDIGDTNLSYSYDREGWTTLLPLTIEDLKRLSAFADDTDEALGRFFTVNRVQHASSVSIGPDPLLRFEQSTEHVEWLRELRALCVKQQPEPQKTKRKRPPKGPTAEDPTG